MKQGQNDTSGHSGNVFKHSHTGVRSEVSLGMLFLKDYERISRKKAITYIINLLQRRKVTCRSDSGYIRTKSRTSQFNYHF